MTVRVYFQGAGLVTALGDSLADISDSLESGPCKPTSISVELSEENIELPYFTINNPSIKFGSERIEQLIDNVITQACEDADLTPDQLAKAGLFLGSTSFDMYQSEMAIKASSKSDIHVAENTPSFTSLTQYIQRRFSISGPVYAFNTACTSSANALIYAADFIRSGEIEHALVLGLEFYNEVTALGFSSLELISQHGMRPFDVDRDGLYLGEGCSALVLSAQPVDDGFVFLAGDNFGDNYSITASNPDGAAIEKVINGALDNAGISSDMISMVKTHGTASLSNDEAELAGLKRIFGDSIPPAVSLKPLIGHTLGACGINELVLFMHSLQSKKLIGYQPDSPDSPTLKFARDADIPDSGHYLLNYFGFGGNNTVLVIANA